MLNNRDTSSQEEKPSLSPEQSAVIESWGQGMAVIAGAGSGKTTTLVSKCARFAELNPQGRLVAVSFTEKSASDLKVKLTQTLLALRGSGSLTQHWMMTIHGLCAAVIQEFPREAGFDGEEMILSGPEAQLLWQKCIESLWVDDFPEVVRNGFERLLDRESQSGLAVLLQRLRELSSFGAVSSLSLLDDQDCQALCEVGQYILEKYDRVKRRQGVLDFSDLELGADRALENIQVRESYHRRFDLILVDEFQDTNPIQARIIARLAKPDLSNLCVVGDPKQSIYRFRDADLTVFEEFCQKLPLKQSLTWNFRSLPGIIHFSNDVCAQAFSASGMRFDPLVPKRTSQGEELISEHNPSVFRLNVNTPENLGAWIQSEVAKGIPLHEMALLVRKIRGNEKWLRALSACGIPIAVGSGGLFWEDPRIREMVCFLKWWDNPKNSLSGCTFLRAPWVGISDEHLDQWLRVDSTLRESFFSSNHPLAENLKNYIGRLVRPGEILMALLVNQKIEEELWAPLLGLWHHVEELSSEGMDFHGIVVELAAAVQQNRREREVPPPKNLGHLTVLTLHGAKGLEFPHVILIDFEGKSNSTDMPLLFWDRNQGAFLGRRTEDGDRDRSHVSELKWREVEKSKNLAESKRLFYVALTRARDRLVLVFPEFNENNKSQINQEDKEDCFFTDNWRAWIERSNFEIPVLSIPLTSSRGIPTYFSESPRTNQNAHFVQKWYRARHSVTEWNLLSRCSLAYEWKFIRPPHFESSQEEQVQNPIPQEILSDFEGMPQFEIPSETYSEMILNEVPDEGMIQGIAPETTMERQEIGTQVHAYLAKGDFEGLRNLEAQLGSNRFSAQSIIQWAEKSPWMLSAQRDESKEVWTELPFEVPFGQETLVGSIDRVVYDKTLSRYTVIDFKVTLHRNPLSVRAIRSAIEAYQTQLELYAWAVHRLDPKISLGQIQTYLVVVSAHAVQVIQTPLGKVHPETMVEKANEIVQGKPGEPVLGPHCRNCDYCQHCPKYIQNIMDLGNQRA